MNELAEPFTLTLPAISSTSRFWNGPDWSSGASSPVPTMHPGPRPLEEISTWAEQYRPVWEARFDRMDDYLTQLRPQRNTASTMADSNASQNAAVIERSFDAPPDLIWQMWTDRNTSKRGTAQTARPSRWRRWTYASEAIGWCASRWTPRGAAQMWFTGEYREVVKNERLVYTDPYPTRAAT